MNLDLLPFPIAKSYGDLLRIPYDASPIQYRAFQALQAYNGGMYSFVAGLGAEGRLRLCVERVGDTRVAGNRPRQEFVVVFLAFLIIFIPSPIYYHGVC